MTLEDGLSELSLQCEQMTCNDTTAFLHKDGIHQIGRWSVSQFHVGRDRVCIRKVEFCACIPGHRALSCVTSYRYSHDALNVRYVVHRTA
jgi:hypothetical protein